MRYLESIDGKFISDLQKSSVVGFDLETTGLDPLSDNILLYQFNFDDDEIYVLNAGTCKERDLQYSVELLADKNAQIVGHNLKFDLKFIYAKHNTMFTNVFCTQIANSVAFAGLTTRFTSLAKLLDKYLFIELPKDERGSFIGKTDYNFTGMQIAYARRDVEFILDLKEKLDSILTKRGQANTFYEIEMPLLPVIAKMEVTGIKFDIEGWKNLASNTNKEYDSIEIALNSLLEQNWDKLAVGSTAYEVAENLKIPVKQLRKAEREILESTTTWDEIKSAVLPMVNWSSPYQPKAILNKLGIPVKTTDKKELQHYKDDYEIVKLMLNIREDDKKLGTYGLDFLKHIHPVTGYIHTVLNQDGAATGRFSSDNPNLQNIIADVEYRSKFIARPGYKLITADYSNIELRIIGEVSKEPNYVKAFLEGMDLHSLTASYVFGVPIEEVTKDQRKKAKSINFGVIYGQSPKGFAYTFNMPISEARAYMGRYFSIYVVLRVFIKMLGDLCLQKGYSKTIGGRKRFLRFNPTPKTDKEYRQYYRARRQGVNHLPQGTSADMIKLALIYMDAENPYSWEEFRPLLTVHDEIIVEVKDEILEDAKLLVEGCMLRAGRKYLKTIPVEIEMLVGDCWIKE